MNNRIRFFDNKKEKNPNLLNFESEVDHCQKIKNEIIYVNDKINQKENILNSSQSTKKDVFPNSEAKTEAPLKNSSNLSGQPKISIIIPCLNEASGLKLLLAQVHKIMSKVKLPYEVIVVDDGSSDQTAEIAQKNYANVLINQYNQGKGGALQRGFKHAKGDFIITMDGDGSHKADDIPRIIEPILKAGYELVIGSRFLNISDNNNATSLRQLVGNKILNYMIWLLTGKHLTDSQSGFRVFSKKLLHAVGGLSSKGYEIESEFSVKSIRRFRNKIIEIPIKNLERLDGVSRLVMFRDGIKILKRIIKDTFSNQRRIKNYCSNYK